MCVYTNVHTYVFVFCVYTQVLASRQISIQECHAYRFQGYESKMWVQMELQPFCLFWYIHVHTCLRDMRVCRYIRICMCTHTITLKLMLNKVPVRTSLVVTA